MKVPTGVMIVGYVIAALFLAAAAAILLWPVWVFGTAGYDVLARLGFHWLAIACFGFGVMMVRALRNGSVEALWGAFPIALTVLALAVPSFGANWGAWERFYTAAGLTVYAFAGMFLVVIVAPTIFATLALRNIRRLTRGQCRARAVPVQGAATTDKDGGSVTGASVGT